MRIAVYDIETWDLTPEFGPLLCASVLLMPEEKMVSFRQDNYVRRKQAVDMTDDKQLCLDLRDLLRDRHLGIGYFTKGFDISHINSRLARHGIRKEEQLLPRQFHIDPIWAFKGWRGLRPMSAKMKHVAKFLGLEQKPEVEAETWLKGRSGNRKAMDVIVDRCEADVRITRQIYEVAMDLGLIKNITRYP